MRKELDKPSPITGGKMELCTEPAEVSFRGETISYEKTFYHCLDSDTMFVDSELEEQNLKLIYDTYRRKHAIPTAEELTQMRQRYGIPARAISIILGMGENQFGLFEDGVIPSVSVGRLLALSMEPAIMKSMLQVTRSSFSAKEYSKYYDAIEASLHPAKYETEDLGLMDFSIYSSSFPASKVMKRRNKISSTKSNYNGFVYAGACL